MPAREIPTRRNVSPVRQRARSGSMHGVIRLVSILSETKRPDKTPEDFQ